MGKTDRTSSAEIVILANDIQGNPRPGTLGQWVPHEERAWWTEDSLQGRGLRSDRTTVRFLERSGTGWRLQVLSDEERADLFRQKAAT